MTGGQVLRAIPSISPVENVLSAVILERDDHVDMIARNACYELTTGYRSRLPVRRCVFGRRWSNDVSNTSSNPLNVQPFVIRDCNAVSHVKISSHLVCQTETVTAMLWIITQRRRGSRSLTASQERPVRQLRSFYKDAKLCAPTPQSLTEPFCCIIRLSRRLSFVLRVAALGTDMPMQVDGMN